MHMGTEATDVFGKIHIHRNSFIGTNSTILPSVVIGENTIVGAGSIVTKSFSEGNVVIGGNPAKIITTTENYVNKNRYKALDVAGLSFVAKKDKILNSVENKLLKK